MNKDEQLSDLSGKFSNIKVTTAKKQQKKGASEAGAAEDNQLPRQSTNRQSTNRQSTSPYSTALVRHVTNAHRDDIHGMISIHDRIITGSKDTSVRMWSHTGDLQKTLLQHPHTTATSYSYKHWITALHSFSDGTIMVGSRNGFITCRDIYSNRTYYSGILENKWNNLKQNNLKHAAYKQRNEPRITSIMCQEGDEYLALIGMPEKFIQLDLDNQKIRRVFQFDSPDWVYGFSQLTLQKIAVIHACTLSVLQELNTDLPENGWEKVGTLVREGKRFNGQRPFISDINRFEENHAQLALAFFGGITRVIDVEQGGKVLHEGREHQQRVWKTLPMDASSYISCADDGLIKVWDVRQATSVHTYTGHTDRVSALALLSNNMFVAGSCPKDPFDDPDKGQLFFYDRRL
ncbi:MAG: hypothetical protein QNK11_06590 [Legionella sp.]|nr:hypothetical protein [Legionella sp.]